MNAVTPKVFISYRREETAGHAGRLYDAIVSHFGEGNVFMDVDLAPGSDFVEQITQAVGACDVLLVIIGPRWAAPTHDRGRPRLVDPSDFVRLEVETALSRPDVTVIPVLVAGARMPDPDDLPDSVRALSRRNALELSDQRWRYDVGRLVSTLVDLLEGPIEAGARAAPPPQARSPTRRWRPRGLLLSGVVGVAALGVGVLVLALAGAFSHTGRPSAAGSNSGQRGPTLDDAVRKVGQFSRLYEARNLLGLRRLMWPDVVLRAGANRDLRGADQVIARYRNEFRSFGKDAPVFDWQNALSDSTQTQFEVIGPYAISAGQITRQTGRFGVLLTSIGSKLLISEICLRCPDLGRPRQLLSP